MKKSRKGVNSGAKNPIAKLNDNKVREIRKLYKPPHNWKTKDLAKRYNVSPITIHQVANNYTWLHVV